MEVVTARQSLNDFQYKLRVIPLQPQVPEIPRQLSLFYATSLEIYQVARWCRASPENTLSDLPIVNDPKDLMLKDDGMALCLYDDTMKVWSTVRDWVPQWSEVGQRITDVIKKNPSIQGSWDEKINNLNMGPESLQNFREDLWVDENGSVCPISSPFMLSNSLDEEVKRMEAAYINLPCAEDEEESHLPLSPLTTISETATTPPLSPCTPFLSPDSIDSACDFTTSPESPFLLTLPVSLSGHRTISPHEIFSPLPQVEDWVGDVSMEELQTPPAPVVRTQSLPEPPNACPDATPPSSPSLTSSPPNPPPSRPNPPLSRPQAPPVAGPSRSVPKRFRWSEDEDDYETDEFTPQPQRTTRKRLKVSTKLDGKGAKCDLCGKRLGRATDLPRHKASCRSNPERATRGTRCEFCDKLLPVRADAIKRHRASKTCLSKRKKGADEDPYLSES